MKVRFTDEALVQARELRSWWRKHRSAAPKLFSNELRDARRNLARNPRIGTKWRESQGRVVYRLLLERSKNWVYYEVDDNTKTVVILSVWGAPRLRQPADND